MARWADVWRWARASAADATPSPDSSFPVLRVPGILGFAPWAGFRGEDFDFFLHPSWEQRTIVRNRVSGAWERIADELDAGESVLLGRFAGGWLRLHDPTAWARTNSGEQVINLSLELMQHELQLNLVGWNHDRAERLLAWLGSPMGHELTDGLRGFEVVLFEREATADHAGDPYWQHETKREVARFDAARLADGRFSGWVADWRVRTDETWRKLAVVVRRTYSRAEVVGAGERIVLVLVSDVRTPARAALGQPSLGAPPGRWGLQAEARVLTHFDRARNYGARLPAVKASLASLGALRAALTATRSSAIGV